MRIIQNKLTAWVGMIALLYGILGVLSVAQAAQPYGCKNKDRFCDNGDGTISDRQTGLMWEKKTGSGNSDVFCTATDCSDPHDMNNRYMWTLAETSADGPLYTNFLNRVNGRLCDSGACQGLGGHTDWRIPTVAELTTILLAQFPCETHPCIDPTFGSTQVSGYWTSSTYSLFPTSAWIVGFEHGSVLLGDKSLDMLFARAVRGGR